MKSFKFLDFVIDTTNDQAKKTWLTMTILRGHMEDVYDLCWSPNSMFLISCSVDNTAMVWDVNKSKLEHIFSDHKGFVKGVAWAWDPKKQYLARPGRTQESVLSGV